MALIERILFEQVGTLLNLTTLIEVAWRLTKRADDATAFRVVGFWETTDPG